VQTCIPVVRPTRSAAPSFEPISLQEAKRQLGIPDAVDQHDVDVADLITFAREQVERDAMLVVATGTFTTKRTEWGHGDYFDLPSSLRPVTAIGSIVYVNTSGSSTTWSSSEYTLETSTYYPVVRLNYGYSWPALRGDINGITVTATAGYAQASVPKRVKLAVILKLQELWLTRQGMQKESDLSTKAYDAIVGQLRNEVYA
jgi:uncharacterized phiE125 gp8 family phage protein